MNLGYTRVSSLTSDVAEPVEGVDILFVDLIGDHAPARVGWKDLLERAKSGDCIVVQRLDEIADNVLQLRVALIDLERRQLKLSCLSAGLDAISPFHLFPAFQAVDAFQNTLDKRAELSGLPVARETGGLRGRRPVLTPDKKLLLDKLFEKSDDYRAHARAIGVSVRTVTRYARGEYLW